MSTSGHVFDTITMNVPYPWWLCNGTHEGSWFFSRHHPKSWSWLCSRTTCMFWQETMHMFRKSIQHCLHSRFLVKTEPINGMVHFFHDILQRWHWSRISIVDSLLPCWSCKDNTSKDPFSQCEQLQRITRNSHTSEKWRRGNTDDDWIDDTKQSSKHNNT